MVTLPSTCRQAACSSRKAARTAATCVGTTAARKGSGACGRCSRMVTCRRAAVLVAAAPAGKNPAGAVARRGSTRRQHHLRVLPRGQNRPRRGRRP
ncbi:hypothetical protein C4D60_Mb06t21800 [Musa balbisiana]|uniref:Uncharacterized protein n=1 Tax=Musa balbisiana TaxID=52838 RepID=A0A4S8IPV1_MUSBA|nr:hypothetical protein C4D60_Mb06t21800 [Musa balbisiana]